MVEKVASDTNDAVAGATGTQEKKPFTSEKVWRCPSCDTLNPASSTRCSGCGDPLDLSKTKPEDTVAATCPNCLGDRPFVSGSDSDKGEYYGECPHCHQNAADAKDVRDKLEHGDSSAWGKGAPH